MKGFKRFAVLGFALCMLSACGTKQTVGDGSVTAEDNEVVLELAEMHMAEHPITKGSIYFGELVKEKTHGRVTVDVCPASLKGSENAAISKVSNGTLDMARVNCVALEGSNPGLKPLTMPYLIESREHLWRVLDSPIGDEMLSGIEGCNGIAWLDSGSRCFYAKDAIQSPQDMQGKTFRVPSSKMMTSLMEAYGANTVNMDFSQVYTAIDDGTIDGAENDIISYSSNAHNVVAKNFVLDNHSFSPSVIIMSDEAKKKISDEDYELILQCAKEAEAKSRELWIEKENQVMEQLKGQKTNIIELTPEQKAVFIDSSAGIYDLYPEYGDVIEEIKKLGDNQ